MSWNRDPYGDSLTSRGLIIVGGAVLFAHVLFPLLWWNVFGGRERFNNPYYELTAYAEQFPARVSTATVTPTLAITPTLTVTPTISPTISPTVTPTISPRRSDSSALPERERGWEDEGQTSVLTNPRWLFPLVDELPPTSVPTSVPTSTPTSVPTSTPTSTPSASR